MFEEPAERLLTADDPCTICYIYAEPKPGNPVVTQVTLYIYIAVLF